MARKERTRGGRGPGCLGRLVRWGLALSLLALLAGVVAAGTLLWLYGRELPDIRGVGDYQPKEVTRIYAATGEEIAAFTDRDAIWRTVVPYEEIPEVMIHAILAAEDGEFFQHPGLDFRGIARAFLTNLRRRELAQGASTITQQVVKNLVLSPERSFRRKVQEAILAWRLEKHLDKEQILWLYLNEVFFGVRYYGIEEASRYYFGHGCSELALEEAALLAGLVQSPNRYNPYRHPERALERRTYVLRQMRNRAWISEADWHAAREAPLRLASEAERAPWVGRFPWFVDAVRRDLLAVYPPEVVFAGGLQVETTLRLDASLAAESALRRGLEGWDERHGWLRPYRQLEGAEAIADWRRDHHGEVSTLGLRTDTTYRAVVLNTDTDPPAVQLGLGDYEVALDLTPLDRLSPGDRSLDDVFPPGAVFSVVSEVAVPPEGLDADEPVRVRMVPTVEGAIALLDLETRELVALVGGYDFAQSSFHRAIQARRQTGSAFKPFIYAAALDAHAIHAAEVFPDQPVTFRMHAGQTWSPQNYDRRYLGPMSVREALARSRNVIVVSILDRLGLTRAHAYLREMGISAPLTDNLTLALGSAELTPLEMTEAFATMADGGVWRPTLRVRGVRSRVDAGPWPAPEPPRRVMREEVAWLMGSLLRSVVERGTGSAARALGHPAAGKTGTTNGPRDAWFVGWTGYYVGGVWLGRDDNGELGRRETGGSAALPIWLSAMESLHEGRDPRPFPEPPPGVIAVPIDPATGLRAREGREGARVEYFLDGTVPREWAPEVGERDVRDTLLQGGGAHDGEPSGPAGHDDGF